MDCRGDELIQHNNRASAQAVPFQYLINEQAKSILALQVSINYYIFNICFFLMLQNNSYITQNVKKSIIINLY